MDKRSILVYWLCSSWIMSPGKAKKIIENSHVLEEMFYEKARFDQYRIRGKAKESLIERASLDLLQEEVASLHKKHIHITTVLDENYPAALREIAVPPAMLYYRGDLGVLGQRDFAIVGARECTRKGGENTFRIGAGLAEQGVNIISGMARGIDSAAHRGALSKDGKTTAVLGCGVDLAYPPENKALYKEICAKGLVMSEYPLGTGPFARNFPQRNRIICGLAQGVMLAEGKLNSGGSITVNYALEQGKEIFAMPGDISSPESALPNTLIGEGASLVLNVKSILEPMGWARKGPPRQLKQEAKTYDFAPCQREVYNVLLKGEHTADELIEITGKTPAQIAMALTMLEMNGLIARLPGNAYGTKRDC